MKYATELMRSGLIYVIAAYTALILLVVVTFTLGPLETLYFFNSNQWGILASFIIFDSWYTILGLMGAVVIFAFVLFEIRGPDRLLLSFFFLTVSIGIAPIADIVWNRYYNDSGVIPGGSSSIAVAAQAIVFMIAIFGMIRLFRQKTWRLGPWSRYWVLTSVILYMAIILGTLFYIFSFQPLFVPTDLYNWRVHQFAFFMGMGSTMIYGLGTLSSFSLDGSIPLDQTLMNSRFIDLNREKFNRSIPLYRVLFKKLSSGAMMECHPELKEIWVDNSLYDKNYKKIAESFDGNLLHQMIHAELFQRDKNRWSHEDPLVKESFNELARGVGAIPEE